MYTVRREVAFDMGHRVPFHEAQCRFLHGHRYTLQAVAEAEETVHYDTEASDAGMVVDFGDLKEAMMLVHNRFDHRLALWEGDDLLGEDCKFPSVVGGVIQGGGLRVVPVIPTAEELARLWFGMIDGRLQELNPNGEFRLRELRVFETPNNLATYTPEEDE